MHEDILKGKWKEIKGEIKKQWGKLTDDDLTQIEGEELKLVGLLQKRYGYSKDEAEKEYKAFMQHHKKAA
ncbi:MAG: CsbD family protein [Nitrospirota bacterium]